MAINLDLFIRGKGTKKCMVVGDIILDKYASYINSIAPKKRDAYDFEEELESQRRRDSWHAEYGRR